MKKAIKKFRLGRHFSLVFPVAIKKSLPLTLSLVLVAQGRATGSATANGNVPFAIHLNLDLNSYRTQYEIANQKLWANLNYPGLPGGFVIASPSKANPNYFFHWTRDAALTMLEVVRQYHSQQNIDSKKQLKTRIQNWIGLEESFQQKAFGAYGSLGEPKYTENGEVFVGPWGRPQNDGPAIRALVFMAYAAELMNENTSESISEAQTLYRDFSQEISISSNGPIKNDLEYVAHHWQEACFDLWEEVKGQHFFTLMAQRAALQIGSNLARKFGDPLAANFYERAKSNLENQMAKHVDLNRGYILNSIRIEGDNKGKHSNLDSAVLLGILYFSLNDGFYGLTDPIVLKTIEKLDESFAQLYEINSDIPSLGTAIGRYPEDVYNGDGFGEANPWFLTTAAFAEYYCRIGNIEKGRTYLHRVLKHLNVDGSMSEQFNRRIGFEQGAVDLSWSYVSYLRAYNVCF